MKGLSGGDPDPRIKEPEAAVRGFNAKRNISMLFPLVSRQPAPSFGAFAASSRFKRSSLRTKVSRPGFVPKSVMAAWRDESDLGLTLPCLRGLDTWHPSRLRELNRRFGAQGGPEVLDWTLRPAHQLAQAATIGLCNLVDGRPLHALYAHCLPL